MLEGYHASVTHFETFLKGSSTLRTQMIDSERYLAHGYWSISDIVKIPFFYYKLTVTPYFYKEKKAVCFLKNCLLEGYHASVTHFETFLKVFSTCRTQMIHSERYFAHGQKLIFENIWYRADTIFLLGFS